MKTEEVKQILEYCRLGKMKGSITFEFNEGGITMIDLHWKDEAEKILNKIVRLSQKIPPAKSS